MLRDRPGGPLPALSSALRRVRRAVLTRRRSLAALLAGVAVLTGLRAATVEPPAHRIAVVAATDLAAGEVLTQGDLRSAAFLPDSLPVGVASAPDLVGRQLATPVRDGELITDARLVGPELVVAPGTRALPLRFPDAEAVGLLRPGDRLDVVATDPRGRSARTVAVDVTVLAVPPATAGSGVPDPLGGRLVLLGVPDHEVTTMSRTAVGRVLSYVFAR